MHFRFNLVKEYLVEFNQVAMLTNEASEDMLNRVMTKDNIGIAALLETNEGLYDNAGNFICRNYKKNLLSLMLSRSKIIP